MKITAPWNVMPCSLVDIYQRARGNFYHHFSFSFKMGATGSADALAVRSYTAPN
jgi:hypothetical protein